MGRMVGSLNRRTPPDCHPDRKHRAFGMCNACYKRNYKGRNLEASKIAAKRYAQRRTETASWRNAWLQRKFNISAEIYDIMLKKQNGVCAICSNTNDNGRRLAVDHDHQTGQIRGLLCNGCNRALGFVERPEWIKLAGTYIGRPIYAG